MILRSQSVEFRTPRHTWFYHIRTDECGFRLGLRTHSHLLHNGFRFLPPLILKPRLQFLVRAVLDLSKVNKSAATYDSSNGLNIDIFNCYIR